MGKKLAKKNKGRSLKELVDAADEMEPAIEVRTSVVVVDANGSKMTVSSEDQRITVTYEGATMTLAPEMADQLVMAIAKVREDLA